jgi:hypothetical protein
MIHKIVSVLRNFFKNDYIEGEEAGVNYNSFFNIVGLLFSFIVSLFFAFYMFNFFGWWGVAIAIILNLIMTILSIKHSKWD